VNSPEMARKLFYVVQKPIVANIAETKEKLYASEKKAIRFELNKELKNKRAIARKSLADELRDARKKLKKIKLNAENEEKILRKKTAEEIWLSRKRLRELNAKLLLVPREVKAVMTRAYESEINHATLKDFSASYPSVPAPTYVPDEYGNSGIPICSGIYFVWDGDVVVYVGQSINLNSRVLLSHEKINANHRISIIVMEKYFLTWAENYYIGALRPQSNYGNAASHNKYKKNE
jgi:hypothetical protein